MAKMIMEQNEVSPDVGGDTLAWLAAAAETGLINPDASQHGNPPP